MLTRMIPRVLIVSQDAELKQQAESLLLRLGFDVICAFTGIQGLRVARLFLPVVIVVDEILPDLDSASVCGILRVQLSTRDIPVVVLFDPGELLIQQAEGAPNAPRFLRKPVEPEALGDCVLELFERQKEEAALQVA